MFKMVFNLHRVLLLLGIFAAASLRCLGQEDIDFSIAPALAPALTNVDSNTAPSTTLAIDLLAPQRSFIYDSTGSSIVAGSLDPTIRVDLLSAESETDTAIRDSVQTGQISPYVSGGSHLSTLFSQAGSAPGSRNGASSPASSASTDGPASVDNQKPYGTDFGNPVADPSGSAPQTEQSSWGAASASSWGGRSSASGRAGTAPSGAAGSSAPLDSGYQSGSSLSADQSSVASADLYRSRPSPSIGWKPGGLTVTRSTSEGIGSSISRVPTTFGAGSTARFITGPGQSQNNYADPAISTGAQAGSGSSQPPPSGLAFSQSAEAGADGSAPGGSSPFSAVGSVDFLQPNILGPSRVSLRRKGGDQSSSADRLRSKPQTENSDNPLETSASTYGLRPAGGPSRPRSSRGMVTKRANPYITSGSSAPNKSSNR